MTVLSPLIFLPITCILSLEQLLLPWCASCGLSGLLEEASFCHNLLISFEKVYGPLVANCTSLNEFQKCSVITLL